MKRLMSAVLAVLMILSLCACGQSGPTWQEQYDLGIKCLEEGNYEEAILAFTAAIEIDPKQAPANVGRGDAYVFSGETEDNLTAAQADYEEAIALDETNANAYLGLADVYIRRGDYDAALELLKAALEKTGNDQSIADKIAEIESGNITDRAGNLRRTSYYEGDGTLRCYLIRTYDAQGRESGGTMYDAAGTEMSHVDVLYNEDGKEVQGYQVYTEGWLKRLTKEYDTEGKLTRESGYGRDGAPTGYTIYGHDAAGNKMREDYYNTDGALSGYHTYEYDAAGNKVRMNDYNADGTLDRYYTYEYDAEGNMVRQKLYEADGTLRTYTMYEYDAEGNMVHSSSYRADGTLSSYTEY